MSKLDELIAKNVGTTAATKPEKTRFMLELDDSVREDLRKLCDEMGAKQIGFASELFTVALKDARKAYETHKAEAAKATAATTK